MPWKSFKEKSKINWGTDSDITREDPKFECLMRIADAVELMAKNPAQLINDRDYFKRRFDERGGEISKLRRQVSAYRGIVNKKK